MRIEISRSSLTSFAGLLFGAYEFDHDLAAGNGDLKVEGTIDRSLSGLLRPVDDQAIASGRKTGEGERDRVGKGGMVFEREAQVREAVVVGDRLPRGERVAIEQQMHALAAGKDVETLAQAVVRHDFSAALVLRDGAAVSVASEDRIIDNDGRGVAKSATNPNTVHLMILMALRMSILGRGSTWRGRSGKLLILRLTPRGLRRLRLETTRS